MFPHCDAFFKNYRLTGRTINNYPPASPTNIIRGSSSSLHQGRDVTNAAGQLEEIAEVTEEAEGNASVLSNLSPSVGDLEDIELIQQDLIREMTEVRRTFYSLIRRVDRMRPDIIRLKRLVDGAGRIADRNQ